MNSAISDSPARSQNDRSIPESPTLAMEQETDITRTRTIPGMFRSACRQRGPDILLRQKDFGIWQEMTWEQADALVCDLSCGLIALEFNPGDCASILSNTVREWLYGDLAILSAGGICSGIYPTDAASQVEFLLQDSGSRIVLVEDEEQLDKVLQVRERLPLLQRIVVFDMKGLHNLDDPQIMSFDALRELGQRQPDSVRQHWETRQHAALTH